MSRSAIYAVNKSAQDVADNGAISFGTLVRRFGCGIQLSGGAMTISGRGYYDVDINVTLAPTVAGDVTIALYKDGVEVPGATATGTVATAEDVLTLPVSCLTRETCCDSTSTYTLMLSGGAVSVTNVATKVIKL